MRLEDLKKICEKRTIGPWGWRNDEICAFHEDDDDTFYYAIIKTDSRVYPPEDNDADFIIAAANSIDKLIKVAEAVKHMLDGNPDKFLEDIKSLRDAVEELEE